MANDVAVTGNGKSIAYYNEVDPIAAQWLRNLIAAGLIAPGVVDERSIEDVRPGDLAGFTQCHFFAGISGWSLALRLAGWPDDRPVWTGSCPCQPFASAGKGAGFDDPRHLWPSFGYLIQERRPSAVFGEQVAGADADPWIDLVHADLEAMDYTFGAVPFPSAGVGAPHIRDRVYWLGHTNSPRPQGHARHGRQKKWQGTPRPTASAGLSVHPGPVNGYWKDADWLMCRDGKRRAVESGTFPLAHGIPARVGRMRAYGNAINVWAAVTFISAAMEALEVAA
ncbi:DNA cytosine methyltransferase [Pseudomonas monteilii]|uniref:DNA cytosine methyltransferase n=1 Tax=Pseudomonas monteilii TaxID=76759 RepID=UPI001FD2E7A9|nr:DNA cytosine methyltransferase [Pseudomonas monteilii]MCJ7854605.1 DNA cytosine methyltransferase [Pseudomonas monteilii]